MDLFYEVSYGDHASAPGSGLSGAGAGLPDVAAGWGGPDRVRIAARAGGWAGEIRGEALGWIEGGGLRGAARGAGDRRIFAGCLARHARDIGIDWLGLDDTLENNSDMGG